MPLVNKAELARLIRVSLPTLSNIIARYPDLPIEKRGTNGDAWQFDPDLVIPFLTAKREEEAEEAAARADLLAEIRLPFDEDPGPGTANLTPAQQLATVRTRMLLAKEAREAGHLVPVTDVRIQLNAAVAGLGQALDRFPAVIGRNHNLPAAVVAEISRELDKLRVAFVRGLGSYHPTDALH